MANYDKLLSEIERLQEKYVLADFNFDTECLYNVGDLSKLLQYIVDKTLPGYQLVVEEELSADQQHYVATIKGSDFATIFTAEVEGGDWLPDHFFDELHSLPSALGSEKRFYAINPAIGLTGQDAWYFCGVDAQLKAARQKGLPIVFPEEDILDTPEYRLYKNLK